MKKFAAIGVVAFALSLTGCTGVVSDEAAPSASSEAISEQQQNALEDGQISWDEYDASFKQYRACLNEAGYSLSDFHTEGELYKFGVSESAVSSGVEEKCYNFWWAQVDTGWQTAHQDDSYAAEVIAECLRRNNLQPSGDFEKNLSLLDQNNIDRATCST